MQEFKERVEMRKNCLGNCVREDLNFTVTLETTVITVINLC